MTALPYNGASLDRAGARRADPAWIECARAHPGARVLAFRRDGCLTADGRPVSFDGEPGVFLGLDGDAGVFAADLSDLAEPDALALAGADAVSDVRQLFGSVDPAEAAVLAYARGMLHWHRNQRFCGACGSATEPRHAGHQLVCGGCGKLLFPRIEPAVIMLVTSPDGRRCLLARHRGAAPDAYSTLAGFVEIGEGLEDAVRRELVEEAGVAVAAVRYQASQAWPFPSGLMVGFRAVAASDVVAVDEDELVEARWFTRSAVRELIERHRAAGRERRDSIESHLVSTWLDEE
ncbi:MAG TPA: NAD(+) diphosphatase [Actinophytocola sp.]|nr:NAD(+) diphosphatase [Actinophytocola sp.]